MESHVGRTFIGYNPVDSVFILDGIVAFKIEEYPLHLDYSDSERGDYVGTVFNDYDFQEWANQHFDEWEIR